VEHLSAMRLSADLARMIQDQIALVR